jgi:hypothetical protein
MKTVTNFLEKYGLIFIIGLIVLQTCVSSNNKRLAEKKNMSQLDSIKIELKNLKESLQKEIKLEGLKVEKRMIQSTDRKILDVTRQGEIDKLIQQLEK